MNSSIESKEIGDKVTFRYKGKRKVSGVIRNITSNILTLALHTDYVGKNVFWEIGEIKQSNINEINNKQS